MGRGNKTLAEVKMAKTVKSVAKYIVTIAINMTDDIDEAGQKRLTGYCEQEINSMLDEIGRFTLRAVVDRNQDFACGFADCVGQIKQKIADMKK